MMPHVLSKKLTQFIKTLSSTLSPTDENLLWEAIETPLVESIPEDKDNCLVTFIYRFKISNNRPKIYLYSTITGLACSSSSQFVELSSLGLAYLTLTLPRKLRTTYSFLIIESEVLNDLAKQEEVTANNCFVPTGDFKVSLDILNILFQQNRVIIDSLNPKEITYYKDYDNPVEYFAKESILELPDAPQSTFLPKTQTAFEANRQQLRVHQRLLERQVSFSETCLAHTPGYFEDGSKDRRKYWIYLPPNYDKSREEAYPLFLFLDGSSYLNTIPVPFMLEKLINEGLIPACVAVFLEYSSEQRISEYDCNEKFTEFLANDFIKCLCSRDPLNISEQAHGVTIVGLSASGLAAFYAGLKYPTIFGNVIAQSPSLEMKKPEDVEALIQAAQAKHASTQVIFNIGSYETAPIDLQFHDGMIQSLSSYDANRHTFELMRARGMAVEWHEFVGGHNDVCWGECLPNHIMIILNLYNEANDESRTYIRK